MVPEPVAVEAAEAPLFEPAAPAYSDQPLFKCDTCSKEFASMRLHVGRVRVRSKLVCELCGKLFNHRNNLAAHAPVCSGKYPLHCSTCGKGFSLRPKLKV
jgi:DNA-directed RNA polymerase subunit RPC12/RpoP